MTERAVYSNLLSCTHKCKEGPASSLGFVGVYDTRTRRVEVYFDKYEVPHPDIKTFVTKYYETDAMRRLFARKWPTRTFPGPAENAAAPPSSGSASSSSDPGVVSSGNTEVDPDDGSAFAANFDLGAS